MTVLTAATDKEGRKVCANLISKGLILVEAIALGGNPNILTLHMIGSGCRYNVHELDMHAAADGHYDITSVYHLLCACDIMCVYVCVCVYACVYNYSGVL